MIITHKEKLLIGTGLICLSIGMVFGALVAYAAMTGHIKSVVAKEYGREYDQLQEMNANPDVTVRCVERLDGKFLFLNPKSITLDDFIEKEVWCLELENKDKSLDDVLTPPHKPGVRV